MDLLIDRARPARPASTSPRRNRSCARSPTGWTACRWRSSSAAARLRSLPLERCSTASTASSTCWPTTGGRRVDRHQTMRNRSSGATTSSTRPTGRLPALLRIRRARLVWRRSLTSQRPMTLGAGRADAADRCQSRSPRRSARAALLDARARPPVRGRRARAVSGQALELRRADAREWYQVNGVEHRSRRRGHRPHVPGRAGEPPACARILGRDGQWDISVTLATTWWVGCSGSEARQSPSCSGCPRPSGNRSRRGAGSHWPSSTSRERARGEHTPGTRWNSRPAGRRGAARRGAHRRRVGGDRRRPA